MKILIIGSGGREHALALALKNSGDAAEIYCAPGNPGIGSIATLVDIAATDYKSLLEFSATEDIGLVVVGPEQPLADGLSDMLACAGILCFGPSQQAARLESSKGFAKEFMKRYDIPTAAFERFNIDSRRAGHDYIDRLDGRAVIKADGLAAGKGVVVAATRREAHEALDRMLAGEFKDAGRQVVIEEYLDGEEASILAICDGRDHVLLASSQDHKRAADGDSGKNTGGMGAYAPAPVITDAILAKIEDRIIVPTIRGMRRDGTPFVGCLYVGLMICNGEPYVVEYNVRFGDPETQAVLGVFDGDLGELLLSAATGKIEPETVRSASQGHACCIVLASAGYPDAFEKGHAISGIDDAASSGAVVYHAGTATVDGKLVNSGGRVLGVTARGATLQAAVTAAYEAAAMIHFENKYMRGDIGKKGIARS